MAPPVLLLVAGAAGGTAIAAAPGPAQTWVTVTVIGAWTCLALTVVVAASMMRRRRRGAVAAGSEMHSLQSQLARTNAESAHLINVTLPSIVKRLQDGVSVDEALAATTTPSDPQLRRLLEMFTAEMAAGEQRANAALSDSATARAQLTRVADDVELLTTKSVPAVVDGLRSGASAGTVLGSVELPSDPPLRALMDELVKEFAISERRAAAAQAASAKALSRVQAKAVSMLADLREMQDRHGDELFGDLLKLDHSTSQLGLLTDRLALLMGGRASRAWNKPIVMESILRGAVGRIAAYQRVRLHNSSNAMIAGFAAEGVMHLLAELMDNAANFSPPIDEVHVYVEERAAGLVVTIEDSGLKMAGAAMKRAEESVSGRSNDLASLQGTRLGLAVVGRLAAKYHMSVNFRPSSRGGTGVVVLFPPQLLAQQRDPGPDTTLRSPAPKTPTTGAAVPAPARPTEGTPTSADQAAAPAEETGPRVATPGGLPVRPPGRTMAAADRDRQRHDPEPGEVPPGRDAGTQFGAFHRGRRSTDGPPAAPAE